MTFTKTFEDKKTQKRYCKELKEVNGFTIIFEGLYCTMLKNEKSGSAHEIYCKEELR